MKILLAMDGSKYSESALQTLLTHYKPDETEVLVLHAVESLKLMPVSSGFGMGPVLVQDYVALSERWRKEGEDLVLQTSQRLQAAGFKVATRVEEGDAKQVILDSAGNWRPDLILLGNQGKTGLDRLLLGSVSEAVARGAPCSVQIVRAPDLAA